MEFGLFYIVIMIYGISALISLVLLICLRQVICGRKKRLTNIYSSSRWMIFYFLIPGVNTQYVFANLSNLIKWIVKNKFQKSSVLL